MSTTTTSLNLFHRINLANCAMLRARENLLDGNRFYSEYMTARSWTKYKCIITKEYSSVDYD